MARDDRRGEGERPEYRVYRSRPGFFGRLRAPDLSSLRRRQKEGGERRPEPERPRRGRPEEPGERGPRRRWLRWALVAALGWLALSFAAFAVSAQIQKSKLAGDAGRALDGNPFLAVSPQNILVLGTDVREPEFASDAEKAARKCYEAAGRGKDPPPSCEPYRADTIMVVRAGGGTFRKLSIPRDAYASIPGHEAQKVNAAYAFGGARLQARAVAGFLGIDVDHVAIVNFRGFRDFVDALGGIEVELDEPVCSEISGGAGNGGYTLDLPAGESAVDGLEALSLARTRSSGDCDGDGVPDASIDDLDRVRFQQQLISGIKGRLTSPWRLPYNFVKGPFIGWNAPKAMVTDMGALTMPQLLLASAIGGDSPTEVLEPSGPGPLGSLIVPAEECRRKVEKLLGGEPPRAPACSPIG